MMMHLWLAFLAFGFPLFIADQREAILAAGQHIPPTWALWIPAGILIVGWGCELCKVKPGYRS